MRLSRDGLALDVRHEDGMLWATSRDHPGLTVSAETVDDLFDAAREAVTMLASDVWPDRIARLEAGETLAAGEGIPLRLFPAVVARLDGGRQNVHEPRGGTSNDREA